MVLCFGSHKTLPHFLPSQIMVPLPSGRCVSLEKAKPTTGNAGQEEGGMHFSFGDFKSMWTVDSDVLRNSRCFSKVSEPFTLPQP